MLTVPSTVAVAGLPSVANNLRIKCLAKHLSNNFGQHTILGRVNGTSYVPNFGGNYSNTTNAGAFYLNFNNNADNTNDNYCGRLALSV